MVLHLYRNFNRIKIRKGDYIMYKDILLKLIQNDNELESHHKVFICNMLKMVETWKQIGCDLLPMPISEKTEVKIRKILNNIGDEMIEICELMIKENNE